MSGWRSVRQRRHATRRTLRLLVAAAALVASGLAASPAAGALDPTAPAPCDFRTYIYFSQMLCGSGSYTVEPDVILLPRPETNPTAEDFPIVTVRFTPGTVLRGDRLVPTVPFWRDGNHGVADSHRWDPAFQTYWRAVQAFRPLNPDGRLVECMGSSECRFRFRPSYLSPSPEGTTTAVFDMGREDFCCTAYEAPAQLFEVRYGVGAAPTAAFTVNPFGGGEFQLDGSASRDPEDGALSYAWDFGDGTIGSGVAVTKRYDRPGRYTVTLTVTDPDGNPARASQEIDVAAPDLGVAIDLPGRTDGRIAVGEVLDVRITLSASPEGVGRLTQVRFDGEPLRVDPAGNLRIVSGPTPSVPAGIDLDPGTSVAFDYRLEVVQAGRVTLSAAARARDAAGGEQTAEASQPLATSDLEVTVTLSPEAIDLGDPVLGPDGRPAYPRTPFTATVTVKNLLDVAVGGVQLHGAQDGLDVESLDGPAPAGVPVDVVDPKPSLAVGRLEPGQVSAPVVFALEAFGGGRFELSTLATGAVEGRADPATGRGAAELPVTTDVILHFEASGPDGPLEEGTTWTINGSVTNVSTTETVRLAPLVALPDGNAGPIGPSRLEDGPPSPDDPYTAPLSATLLPGDSVSFVLDVETTPFDPVRLTGNPLVHSAITFDPRGFVTAEDGSEVPLEPGQIFAEPGSLEHRLTLFPAVPRVELLSTWDLWTGAYGSFTWNFVLGMRNSVVGLYHVLHLLADTAERLRVENLVAATTDYLLQEWRALPSGRKDELISEVAADVWASVGAGWEKAGRTFGELQATVNNGITDWFFRLDRAGSTGDMATLVEVAGEPGELFGQLVTDEVVGLALMEALARLVKVPRYSDPLAETDAAQQAEVPIRAVGEGLDDVRVGDDLTDLPGVIAAKFGLSSEALAFLLRYCEERNLVIALRSRKAHSIELERLGLRTKPEEVKIKNVDDVDVAYLDYLEDDFNTVVLKEPVPADRFFDQVLPSVPDADRAAVLDRYLLREAEWLKHRATLERYDAEGSIPVSFRYDRQGVPETVVPSGPAVREDFALEPAAAPDGTSYRRVLVSGRRTTGDQDLIYIGRADGLPLTHAERVAIYGDLQLVAGINHGESFTLVDDLGVPTSAYSSKHFAGNPNAEPLLVLNPSGRARVGLIDEVRSRFPTSGDPVGEAVFTYVLGADKGYAPLPPPRLTPLEDPVELAPWTPTVIALPKAILDEHGQRHELRTETGPEAAVYRQTAAGALERWSASGSWQPVDATSLPPVVAVLPQTLLAEPATAGGTVLDILPAEDPADPWFAPGDRIALDPGGPNESFAVIDRLGSLVLHEPLASGHPAGTLVTVVPDADAPGLALTAPAAAGATTLALDDGGLAGRVITIAPGEPVEERALVVSTSPLRLARPLRFGHPAGTQIEVEPDGLYVSADRAVVRLKRGSDTAELDGVLRAASGSSPACGDDVEVVFGEAVDETLDGRLFKLRRGGCAYTRPPAAGGAVARVALELGTNRFRIAIDRVELSGLVSPLTTGLAVGGDRGGERLVLTETRTGWIYRR